MNAAAVPDPDLCGVLVGRIAELHEQHGAEAGVREQLAQGLFNATVAARDQSQRVALVARIAELHENYGAGRGVREQLARALLNATAGEPDPAKRAVLANRIEELHERYGAEPAVREELVRALYNVTNAAARQGIQAIVSATLERLTRLELQYADEPIFAELRTRLENLSLPAGQANQSSPATGSP
ncbi:MAG: hypothetical protein IT162_17410, partial [Bryobacterales bacterium]|nr:hypothetical protein [Bryobacterales bacterium]